MVNADKLRGLVYERFKTQSAFADKMGWSVQYTSYALKHPDSLRLKVIHNMIDVLGIAGDPIATNIFLPVEFK